MIPKKIHYCWFGRGEKPELVLKCIESWKKHCPDYEIVEWNEDNWNINFCRYTKEAYEEKKWAFVSDVARLEIICREGGVYLDTDVELINSLDDLLQYDAYFGFENPNGFNTGIGFGGIKGHFLIKELLDDYLERPLRYPRQKRLDVCTKIQTDTIRKVFDSLVMDGTFQIINGVAFLPEEYLNPYNGVTDMSISIHHSSLSWMDQKQRNMNNNSSKHHTAVKLKWIKRIRNPRYTLWIEKHLGKKVSYIYMFMTYDLVDYGIWYFVKKGILRLKRRG